MLMYVTDPYQKAPIRLFPFIYLFVCIIIACIPVLKYNESKINQIEAPSYSLLNAFTVIYLFAAIIVMPDIIKNIIDNSVAILSDVDAGKNAYFESHALVSDSGYSLSNIFAIIFGVFSDAAIIVFFYYLIYYPQKKIIIVLFVVSIVVQILSNITEGLRTGTVLKSLSFLVAYITMRGFLSKNQRRVFKTVGSVFGAFVLLLVLGVSISRFGDSDEGMRTSVLVYVGQGNINFNEYVLDETSIRYGDRTANGFKQLLGMDPPPSIEAVRQTYSSMRINDSHFYTFVGDFVLDYGAVVTVILFIVFSFLFCIMTKTRNGRVGLGQLIMLFFCMNVVTKGGFYLFPYAFKGNLSILGSFLIYAIFQLNIMKKKQ